MKELTVEMFYKDKQREEFMKVMKETEYGWRSSGKYANVGCPSDLPFVSENDEPHKGSCHMDCKDCWKYVLKNKWK